MNDRGGPQLPFEPLVERSERLGSPPLHLQDRRRTHGDPVTLPQTVDDLGNREPMHPQVDEPRDESDPERSMRRVERLGFDSAVTARTGVAGDLEIEDEGLRWRQVGDRSASDLERLSECSSALATTVESEAQRWSVGNGSLARTACMARPNAHRSRLARSNRPTVEDPARRNARGLRGLVGGGPGRQRGLHPTVLLLEPSDLLAKLLDLLRAAVRLAQTACEGSPLLGVEWDGLVVLYRRNEIQDDRRIHAAPLVERRRRSPESTFLRTGWTTRRSRNVNTYDHSCSCRLCRDWSPNFPRSPGPTARRYIGTTDCARFGIGSCRVWHLLL